MASKNQQINHGKVNRILAMVVDMSDEELAITINKLREEQSRRGLGDRDLINKDTISL